MNNFKIMNKFNYKFIILMMTMMLIASNFISVADETTVDKQEEILKEIESQLKALDDSHGDFINQKNEVVKNIRSIESTVRGIEDEIFNLNGDIDQNKIQIVKATLELTSAIEVLEDTMDLLDTRIRIMYKNGTVGYFEVILESNSFEDLLVRISMLNKIIESDTYLIEELEKNKEAVNGKKNELESEQVKLVNLQEEKKDKQNELENRIAELEETQRSLQSDIQALAIQIDDTNEDAEKIKKIIEDLKLMEKYVGGVMIWPAPGNNKISSPFGTRIHPILKVQKMHTGIDIPCNTGTPILAAQGGKIIWSNWLGGYGKAVMIDHGGGIVTLYAHNSNFIAKKGDVVVKGQNIALSGSTGNSTGPHLHFEVRVDGDFVNPLEWLTSSN